MNLQDRVWCPEETVKLSAFPSECLWVSAAHSHSSLLCQGAGIISAFVCVCSVILGGPAAQGLNWHPTRVLKHTHTQTYLHNTHTLRCVHTHPHTHTHTHHLGFAMAPLFNFQLNYISLLPILNWDSLRTCTYTHTHRHAHKHTKHLFNGPASLLTSKIVWPRQVLLRIIQRTFLKTHVEIQQVWIKQMLHTKSGVNQVIPN